MTLYIFIFLIAAAVAGSCWVLVHEADADALENGTLKGDDLKFERKRQAKRSNERVKLGATFVSNFGVLCFGGFLITPLAKGEKLPDEVQFGVLAFLIISHASAHFILHRWRSED